MAALTEYLWIAVCGGIFGFMYGFLIGANDVANAFATSVSSKSITLKQAVLIASICEFSGAFFLGASVTSTVRSKIFDVDLYEDEPDVVMLGMFTSLLSANLWLFIATHFGIPVSTTHDIVGCIMGFSIACKGFSSINWNVAVKIFISWLTSPLVAGIVAGCFFALVKYFVMRARNPFQRAYYLFPVVLTIGIGVDLAYVLYKGVAIVDVEEKFPPSWGIPVCIACGAFCGLLWIVIFGPCAKKRVDARVVHARNARAAAMAELEADEGDGTTPASANNNKMEDGGFNDFQSFVYGQSATIAAPPVEVDAEAAIPTTTTTTTSRRSVSIAPNVEKDVKDIVVVADNDSTVPSEDAPSSSRSKGNIFTRNTWDQDLHSQSMRESKKAAAIWAHEEQFDENAEGLFTFIQVFTASLNSFAHGANDVANTIAPMSAIMDIYKNGEVNSKTGVQKWVLAYGGLAIVIGLLLYGYRVMKSLGYKLTMLSPSRGSSAELGASLTVVTASFLGIPVSTTQCIVGAVTAVGLVGGRQSVDWFFLLKICGSWAALFFIACIFSAGVFSFAYYSPSQVLAS